MTPKELKINRDGQVGAEMREISGFTFLRFVKRKSFNEPLFKFKGTSKNSRRIDFQRIMALKMLLI
jgi:hypothetical protein